MADGQPINGGQPVTIPPGGRYAEDFPDPLRNLNLFVIPADPEAPEQDLRLAIFVDCGREQVFDFDGIFLMFEQLPLGTTELDG